MTLATQRPALTDASLRETRDSLLDAVTKQQVRGGAGKDLPASSLPDVSAAEEFIVPILHKVEVDHEAERRKDLVREDAAARQADAMRHRRRDSPPPDGVQIVDEWAGDYEWDLKSDKIRTVSNGSWQPKTNRREGQAIKASRARLRMLAKMPAWRDRITSVFFAMKPLQWKEREFRKILRDSVKLFGDPRKVTAHS